MKDPNENLMTLLHGLHYIFMRGAFILTCCQIVKVSSVLQILVALTWWLIFINRNKQSRPQVKMLLFSNEMSFLLVKSFEYILFFFNTSLILTMHAAFV